MLGLTRQKCSIPVWLLLPDWCESHVYMYVVPNADVFNQVAPRCCLPEKPLAVRSTPPVLAVLYSQRIVILLSYIPEGLTSSVADCSCVLHQPVLHYCCVARLRVCTYTMQHHHHPQDCGMIPLVFLGAQPPPVTTAFYQPSNAHYQPTTHFTCRIVQSW